jgi:GntR family transcriptional regulator
MRNRYEDIADELRQDIVTGTFRMGSALPSETQLAERFGASVPTVRAALGLLQNSGLIEKRPGKGNFVLRPFERLTYTNDRPPADRPTTSTTALTVTVSSDEVAADDRLSAHLQVPVGTPLNMYVYLSHQGTSPHSLARIYVPCTVANLSAPQTGWSPLGHDIRARLADLGIRPVSTVEHITARLPEPSEERLLRLGPNTAVLAIQRKSIDEAGEVIEAAVLVLPGHRSEAVFRTRTPVAEAETAR